MYAFQSSPARGALHAMVMGAFAAAAILFGVSGVESVPYPLIFQSAAMVCFVVAVYLCTRYSLRLYRYAVERSGIVAADGSDTYELTVTEIVGKRQKIVARVALRDIAEVAVVRRADKEALRAVKERLLSDRRVFSFANVPVMAEACYISLPEEGAVLVIPADAGMVRILKGQNA